MCYDEGGTRAPPRRIQFWPILQFCESYESCCFALLAIVLKQLRDDTTMEKTRAFAATMQVDVFTTDIGQYIAM